MIEPELGTRKRAYDIDKKGHELFEWCQCALCFKKSWKVVLQGKVAHLFCVGCAQIAYKKTGADHHAWKGGRRTSNGYVYVYLPKNHPFRCMGWNSQKECYVLEHRLVMAEHLGRPLLSSEIVHHKDGIRNHNDISNLELTKSLAEHSKEHSRGYRAGFEQGYQDGLNTLLKEKSGDLCLKKSA